MADDNTIDLEKARRKRRRKGTQSKRPGDQRAVPPATTEPYPVPAVIEVKPEVLPKRERDVLFGEIKPTEVMGAVMTAGSGLAILSSRYLAKRLADPNGPEKLTARDKIALELAPRMKFDLTRKAPGGGGGGAPATDGRDPITELAGSDTVTTET
jgi:hypothetical protein